jgi:nucleotide-binding universal stress UspA family protein
VTTPPQEDIGQRIDEARAVLDSACRRIGEEEIDIGTLVLEGAEAAPRLLEEAARLDPDVIVVGACRQDGRERGPMPCTSRLLLQQSGRPILVVPGRTAAGSEWSGPGLARARPVRCACASAWFG